MATRNQQQQQKPAQEPCKAWPAKRKPSMRERYAELRELMEITEGLLFQLDRDGPSDGMLIRLSALHMLVVDANSQPPIFK